MHMYTYTHGWAHELSENVHENGFPVFGKIREAEHFRGVPSSQPASQEMGWTTSGCVFAQMHPQSSHPGDGLDNMWVCICTSALPEQL